MGVGERLPGTPSLQAVQAEAMLLLMRPPWGLPSRSVTWGIEPTEAMLQPFLKILHHGHAVGGRPRSLSKGELLQGVAG